MIGLSFEIQDTYTRTGKGLDALDDVEKKKQELQIQYSNVNVEAADLVSYAFCYIGCLTGR